MTFLYYLILFLHIAACLFLIAVVLLQQGKGQDLASAFGGGGTQTAFGPRGSATVLSRATAILAGLFMVTSMGLSLMKPRSSGILDQIPAATASPTPGASRPRPPRPRRSRPHRRARPKRRRSPRPKPRLAGVEVALSASPARRASSPSRSTAEPFPRPARPASPLARPAAARLGRRPQARPARLRLGRCAAGLTVVSPRQPARAGAKPNAGTTVNGSCRSMLLPLSSSRRVIIRSYSPGGASTSRNPIIRERWPSDVGLIMLGAMAASTLPSGRLTTYPCSTRGIPVCSSFFAP